MTCAIYARKSTEQNGVSDDQKSVARQVEHARAYASRKGWTVAEEYAFLDDGISGAEFANRPGFVRLMNALKPQAAFDVLVVSELSRLGREQLELGYALKQLSQAGVKVWSYLDDREVLLDTPTDKFLMSAMSFAAEMEREKARQRVTDAMLRKARAGHVCGGACFGYDNVEVLGPDGRRSHVERTVNEGEAEVVRRIFQMCAGGMGVKRLAKALNADGVPSPRPQRGRPRAWSPSSVRSVLHRDLYRGVSVWNRSQQSDAWGQRAWRARPESDWIRTDVPDLRVVSDQEWDAAHRRLKSAAAVYLRSTNGHLWGRPPSGIESKYLLSGSGQCACCGASMTVRSSSRGRRRHFYFICASYDHRGRTVCANGLPLPMATADEAILTTMADYVLAPEVVEGAILDAVQELRPSHDTVEAKRAALGAELRRVEEEQARFVAAIAKVGDVDALATALKERDRDRARLRGELAALDGMEELSSFDPRRIERDLRKKLDEWRGLLRRQTPLSRQVLARLLDGRIVWTPNKDEARYEFSGRVRFDRLLSGVVFTRGMASPTGLLHWLNVRPSLPPALSRATLLL